MKLNLGFQEAIFFLSIFFNSNFSTAQTSQIEKTFVGNGGGDSKAEAYANISRMVQNPLLASGLTSSAESINRSVDSIMESIFYSIMDQELNFEASDTMSLKSGYRRDVHPASIGRYVVVDHFEIGPDFLKNLGKIQGLPLTFGTQAQLFISNANYRSDAQRKSESMKFGFWRGIFVNWLGILPFLSYILPPSFNPEELNDPITYLQTPFLFPTTVEQALKLPLGNVRSYGLSGNLGLTLDTVGKAAQSFQSSLGLDDLDLAIPLSLFREGEHRITILHKGESHVWLALNETRRIGGSISASLGKQYQVLQKLVSWWAGVPAPILPVNLNLEKARVYRIDELYDFDLKKEEAREAFTKALHGDFHRAREISGQNGNKSRVNSGVSFQFHRVSTKDERSSSLERSFYLAQNRTQSHFGSSENQVRDSVGDFLSLEVEQTNHERNWNILVGADTVEFHNRVSIPVLKQKGPGKAKRFVLPSESNNLIYLISSLRIIDNFVDTREYRRILRTLRRFSSLPLKEATEIPIFAEDLRKKLIAEQALDNPMDQIYQQPLTATHLGKLAVNAHIYFSHEIMLTIAQMDNRALWVNLANSFGADPDAWATRGQAQGVEYYSNLFGSYAVFPFRILGFDLQYADITAEARRIRQGLDQLLESHDPQAILAAYEKILDTNHPLELIQSLTNLAKGQALAILVGFDTQSQAYGGDSRDLQTAKTKFRELNNKIFDSPWPIPSLKRNQSIEEKLAHFNPGGFTEGKKSPRLVNMELELERNPETSKGQLNCRMKIENLSSHLNIVRAYLRIERHGAVNLGRFILGEEIVSLSPHIADDIRAVKSKGLRTFALPLNGNKGLAKSGFFDDAIAKDGSFDIHISLSEDSDSWAPEQSLTIHIENGLLKPQ